MRKWASASAESNRAETEAREPLGRSKSGGRLPPAIAAGPGISGKTTLTYCLNRIHSPRWSRVQGMIPIFHLGTRLQTQRQPRLRLPARLPDARSLRDWKRRSGRGGENNRSQNLKARPPAFPAIAWHRSVLVAREIAWHRTAPPQSPDTIRWARFDWESPSTKPPGDYPAPSGQSAQANILAPTVGFLGFLRRVSGWELLP